MNLTEIRERQEQHQAEINRLNIMENDLLLQVFPISTDHRSMLYHLERMKRKHTDDPVLYEMILSEMTAQLNYLSLEQDKPSPFAKYNTREIHAIVDSGDYERLLGKEDDTEDE